MTEVKGWSKAGSNNVLTIQLLREQREICCMRNQQLKEKINALFGLDSW